jgi:hypothetical protein
MCNLKPVNTDSTDPQELLSENVFFSAQLSFNVGEHSVSGTLADIKSLAVARIYQTIHIVP